MDRKPSRSPEISCHKTGEGPRPRRVPVVRHIFLDPDKLVSNDVDSRKTGSGSRVDFRRFAKETGEIRSGSRVDFWSFARKPKLLASSAT